MKAQQKNGESGRHVLLEKGVITHIKNWEEWKECWQGEDQAEYLNSLLHFGFNIPVNEEEAAERLCLYLEIADGISRSSNFVKENEEGEDEFFRLIRLRASNPCKTFVQHEHENGIKTRAEFRKMLAKKAFQVLCLKFFKNTSKEDYLPSWYEGLLNPSALAKLFWFFRPENSWYSIEDHYEKIVYNFAYDFCIFIWNCANGRAVDKYFFFSQKIHKEDILLFQSVSPDVITVLNRIGKLDFLLYKNRYQEVSEDCLNRLEELALNKKLSLPKIDSSWQNEDRKPKDIEEACFGGSQAAKVLTILQIQQKEGEKFDKLRKLEDQRQQAEKELKKLTK